MSLFEWYEYFQDGRVSLILGSASKARRDLIEQLQVPFSVQISEFPENLNKAEIPAMEYPLATSRGKHADLLKRLNNTHNVQILVTCDTVVVYGENTILEKPDDQTHAAEMLASLSANTHRVVTGVVISIVNPERKIVKTNEFTTVSKVTFKQLSKNQIDTYVNTKEPMGKAGSYALQGLGQLLVENINGSYTNVAGIPISEVADSIANLLEVYFSQ